MYSQTGHYKEMVHNREEVKCIYKLLNLRSVAETKKHAFLN